METREKLPALLERRIVTGTDLVATVLDDGRLVIDVPGKELQLSARAAFDLLALLYDHRELLYRKSQQEAD